MSLLDNNGLTYFWGKIKSYVTSVLPGVFSGSTPGLVPTPTAADTGKFLTAEGGWQDGGRPMVVLSYGNSTWDDFIDAYNNHVIVYCKASSNANPKTGAQTRMAFMAYVNAEPPTNVEFQYYRSVSSHSATQQGDQVFIYKLDKTAGWSVTTREAMSKIAAGTNMTSSYSNGTLTLNATSGGTDVNVTQSPVETDANYEILFSGSADNIEHTEGTGKGEELLYNPNKKALTIGSRKANTTIGEGSVVIGSGCEAGSVSYAEGLSTTSTGGGSHSEGVSTSATQTGAHAEGYGTVASQVFTHAEGYSTTASQFYAHAEGNGTVASGTGSHAEGRECSTSADYSHVEGYLTEINSSSAIYAHVEGYESSASAEGAHVEGYRSSGEGQYSHVEGSDCTTGQRGSHAEGYGTISTGFASHSEGKETEASETGAHAEGISCVASAPGSHAEGQYTIASQSCQHVFGSYNIEDTQNQYLEIVGNGSRFISPNRRNARTLDWSGNEVLMGKLTVGTAPTANMDVATKQYVDNADAVINSDLATKADKTWTLITNQKITANATVSVAKDIRNYSEFLIVCGSNGSSGDYPAYIETAVLPAFIAFDHFNLFTYYGDATYRWNVAVVLSNPTESAFTIRFAECVIGSPYATNGLRAVLFAR